MYNNVRKNLLFLGMIIGTVGFIFIVSLLTQRPDAVAAMDALGTHIHQFISNHEGLKQYAIFITSIGNKNTYIFLCALLAISFFFIKRKKLVLFILFTFIFSVVANSLIKDVFERERPDLLHLVHASGFSFPSGHAMNSIVFFGFMAYFFCGVVQKHWQKGIIIAGFTALILLIAISRVAVGVHYVSDISAGLCVGLVILCFSIFIYEGTEKSKR